MPKIDFATLNEQAKLFAGFDAQDERELSEVMPRLAAELDKVTDAFYSELATIPEAKPFLEGRLDALRSTHRQWLEKIFTGPYDADFAAYMHRVGVVHVQVKLPEKFMASGIGLINKHLIPVLTQVLKEDPVRLGAVMKAVNGVTVYCLIIMQVSYREHELERFMDVTGISEALYANLAAAYRQKTGVSPE